MSKELFIFHSPILYDELNPPVFKRSVEELGINLDDSGNSGNGNQGQRRLPAGCSADS